jgi:hypothetical protein
MGSEYAETIIILAANCNVPSENVMTIFESMSDQDRSHMLSKRYEEGQTILHVVAIASHLVNLVKRLLQYGMDPNALTSKGMTPLMIACKENATANVEMLLAYGADPDLATGERFSPLSISILNENFQSIRMLLDANAMMSRYTFALLFLKVVSELKIQDKVNTNAIVLSQFVTSRPNSLARICRYALRRLELIK